MNDNTEDTYQDQEFEKELFISLKYYGYLFPSTDKEVENFEKIHGQTDIAIPTSLNDAEKLLNTLKTNVTQNHNTKPLFLNDQYRNAAFHSKSNKKDDFYKSIKNKNDGKDDV